VYPSPHRSTPDLPDWDKNTFNRLAAEYCDLGETLLETKDYHRAKSAYQIAIDYSPQLAIAHNGLARVEYYLGNYHAALTAADLAVSHHARIDFYYHRTLIIKALNDDDRVISSSHQAIAPSSQNFVNWQLNEIEFDRLALANFDLYIEANPEDPNGYCYRGMYYDRLEHYHLAVADFDRAISLQPGEALFHHARGCVYQHLGNFTAALTDYDLVIQLQPALASVYDNRGEIARLSGDLHLALADYDRAISLNPLFVAAYFHRGITRTALGNIDEALADFDRVIAIDPKYIDAYIRRSWIFFRRGKYAQVISDCKLVIHIGTAEVPTEDRECFQAYYLLGIVHAVLGFKHRAIENFTDSIELAPNYLAARYYRGIIYRELGSLEKSDRDFLRAKSLQDCQLDRSIDLDETRLYAEGIALYHAGQIQPARSMLNLADLYARQSENNWFHEQIVIFLDRHY
jgi:tetratricopeptide (TPR) repeat protein